MIEYMLADIIGHEFEKVAGKQQNLNLKAMHIGFSFCTGDSTDQYRVCHMYLYAPCNYVHVAIQTEVIDEDGKRHVEPMEHLCYHDSCWRDAVQSFIFKNRDRLSVFRSFGHLFDWYDVLTLTEPETDFLSLLDRARHTVNFGTDQEKKILADALKANPFDKRGLWKD